MVISSPVIGVPWYREHDYNGVRELLDDGQCLPTSYRRWLESAEDIFDYLEHSGITVAKVYVEPEAFPSWCATHKVCVNRYAVRAFVKDSVVRKNLNP